MPASRKGARRAADIPPDVLAALERGEDEALTLVENLATDFRVLLGHAVPSLSATARAELDAGAGVTKRMVQVAEILLRERGAGLIAELSSHRSDLVRGWAAYMQASAGGPPLAERLAAMRPFAADAHFGVREWAWLAVRPWIVAAPLEALDVLGPWARDADENVRRFASEATRPRGVWCSHIAALKEDPTPALPLLNALHADPSRYVQDSVANWLNDAGKTAPGFVRECCARWRAASDSRATDYVVKRALRNL